MTGAENFICVPISAELYQSMAARYPDRVRAVLENVVWDFLERTEGDLPPEDEGTTWGRLFLPGGTKFMMKYKGKNYYAEVKGGSILFEGAVVSSPSQLASRIASNTSVNAWKHLWVKRPIDSDWCLAAALRDGLASSG